MGRGFFACVGLKPGGGKSALPDDGVVSVEWLLCGSSMATAGTCRESERGDVRMLCWPGRSSRDAIREAERLNDMLNQRKSQKIGRLVWAIRSSKMLLMEVLFKGGRAKVLLSAAQSRKC